MSRAMAERLRVKEEGMLKLARQARAKVDKITTSGSGVDAVELSEFTQEALSLLQDEEEKEMRRLGGAMSQAGGQHDAAAHYKDYFLEGTGRTAADGMWGAAGTDPYTTEAQRRWSDAEWAEHFL